MRLVQVADGWQVAEGGLVPFSAGTPQAGLQSFFAAVDAGRLDQVRRLIPARHLPRLGSDDALRDHLAAVMDRIEQARANIADTSSFAVDGAGARLVYGPGRSVRMEREAGTWKVADLE